MVLLAESVAPSRRELPLTATFDLLSLSLLFFLDRSSVPSNKTLKDSPPPPLAVEVETSTYFYDLSPQLP